MERLAQHHLIIDDQNPAPPSGKTSRRSGSRAAPAKSGMARVFLYKDAIGFDLALDELSFTLSSPNATEHVVYYRHLEGWVRERASPHHIDVAAAFDDFVGRYVSAFRQQVGF
jgi:hypothetical protein